MIYNSLIKLISTPSIKKIHLFNLKQRQSKMRIPMSEDSASSVRLISFSKRFHETVPCFLCLQEISGIL